MPPYRKQFFKFMTDADYKRALLKKEKHLIATKQTISNLATHMQDGVEYEVILRKVEK